MASDDLEAMRLLRKTRADRRAYRALAIARAIRVARLYGMRSEHVVGWAKHNADNLKACSCWMCGNTRRWFGPKTTEIRTREALSNLEE